ncbi:MAG: 4Fe-4S binding protein [Syntrophobacteraceae bacterium]|nr:4Fe-4S binding protein [Syntrophobacteraceae bacterium]
MGKREDRSYVMLQRHLDRQAVGFPATRSGAEIRILKHIFSPLEAEIATCLTYKPETLERVFERAADLVGSPAELAQILGDIEKKGGIEARVKEGKKHYCNLPLVVGMYELQSGRLTPEFVRDFDEYTRNVKFGIEYLATQLPQLRTIPVGRSIRPINHVATFDQVADLLEQALPPFAVVECICRRKKEMEGERCKVTERNETCLGMGGAAASILAVGAGKEISRRQAVELIEQNQKEGLVLQPSNTRQPEFICSCCGCCCGVLAVHKMLPKPLEFWATNFHAVVDETLCNGCGACEKRCQVAAVRVAAKKLPAKVERDRCIGCGLCVSACPEEALSLRKNRVETAPPATREELYDIMMAGKKGRLGKLKLVGKIALDSIRAGRPGWPAKLK